MPPGFWLEANSPALPPTIIRRSQVGVIRVERDARALRLILLERRSSDHLSRAEPFLNRPISRTSQPLEAPSSTELQHIVFVRNSCPHDIHGRSDCLTSRPNKPMIPDRKPPSVGIQNGQITGLQAEQYSLN